MLSIWYYVWIHTCSWIYCYVMLRDWKARISLCPFVGFDTTFIFGWTLSVARSNLTIFQWCCYKYNRIWTWFTNRWDFLRDFIRTYCCSVPGAGLRTNMPFTSFVVSYILKLCSIPWTLCFLMLGLSSQASS